MYSLPGRWRAAGQAFAGNQTAREIRHHVAMVFFLEMANARTGIARGAVSTGSLVAHCPRRGARSVVVGGFKGETQPKQTTKGGTH